MSNLLQVDTTGFKKIHSMTDAVVESLDEDKLADEAGAILLSRLRTRFLDRVDPDGKKWAVSQASLNRKKSGRDGGTLFDTGALFHSIQLFKRGTGVRAIATDVPYAKFAQNGPPQRIYMGFGEEDKKVVNLLVKDRIAKALASSAEAK